VTWSFQTPGGLPVLVDQTARDRFTAELARAGAGCGGAGDRARVWDTLADVLCGRTARRPGTAGRGASRDRGSIAVRRAPPGAIRHVPLSAQVMITLSAHAWLSTFSHLARASEASRHTQRDNSRTHRSKRSAEAGPGGVGRRCWLRAGVGPWHGSADRGRSGREHPAAAKGPDAQAWHQGPGYRRDGNTRGPPGIAVLPLVRPCFPGSVGGPRRAVAPAPPAAADGARDRRGSRAHRVLCPAGDPSRAAAKAEDRRRLSPGRSRIGSPAAGSTD